MRKDLFSKHSMASDHLMAALLSIFVDIEHTGESMEFEDKFGKNCFESVVSFHFCSYFRIQVAHV